MLTITRNLNEILIRAYNVSFALFASKVNRVFPFACETFRKEIILREPESLGLQSRRVFEASGCAIWARLFWKLVRLALTILAAAG